MARTKELSQIHTPNFSLPGWLVAWICLILLGLALHTWNWLSPSEQTGPYSEILMELPSFSQEFTEGAPFLPTKNTSRVPPSQKNAGKIVGTHENYRVAIIMMNLGLDPELLQRASKELPVSVDFALRSDTPNLQETVDQLRASGREVLLMVPMEPDGYPHNDPGPNPLLTSNSTEENLKRLTTHTENARGIIGIGPFMGQAFTHNAVAIEPIASWLSTNGFALLDFTNAKHRNQFVEATLRYGGTYIDNPIPLTEALSDEYMKLIKLEYMEAVAKREMMSVGTIEASPQAIPFLNEWLKTLPEKQILLTPVSSVYLSDVETSEIYSFEEAEQPIAKLRLGVEEVQKVTKEPPQTEAEHKDKMKAVTQFPPVKAKAVVKGT